MTPLDGTSIITTDGLDPKITFQNTIDNETPFDWTGYQINFYMEVAFTVDDVSVDNAGWDATYDTTAVSNGTNYVATITYDVGSGAAIPKDGSTLDFQYAITFGNTDTFYNFCQEMTPTPEPATMSLLALGGLAILRKRRK
jgi:hypothetical protein